MISSAKAAPQPDTRSITHLRKSLTRDSDPKFFMSFSLSLSSHSSATGLMKHAGGGLTFFMNPSEGNFLRCPEERSRGRPRGAICIFGIVNTSVAYRERLGAYFRPPYINPLFNTPLSARPAGKAEEGVGGGRGRWRTKAAVVNRNYEAARLRICRAGSKRFRESVRAHAIAASDVLDHRREYSARRL